MYDSMSPDYFDYVVSLRDSKRRYYSHWNHLVIEAEKVKIKDIKFLKKSDRHKFPLADMVLFHWMMDLHSSQKDLLSVARQDPVHYNLTIRDYDGKLFPVGNWTKWYMGQPDNYNLRMICGSRCKTTPKYQITQELFDYTLHRLANFSHVIFVEDMEESFGKFAKAYGWQYNMAHTKRLNVTTLTNILENEAAWDPFMSVLDDALYEFARRKYHNVIPEELWRTNNFANQDMVDKYFRDGPSRNCKNECCGTCSKW
jgi:hypothetical protein